MSKTEIGIHNTHTIIQQNLKQISFVPYDIYKRIILLVVFFCLQISVEFKYKYELHTQIFFRFVLGYTSIWPTFISADRFFHWLCSYRVLFVSAEKYFQSIGEPTLIFFRKNTYISDWFLRNKNYSVDIEHAFGWSTLKPVQFGSIIISLEKIICKHIRK